MSYRPHRCPASTIDASDPNGRIERNAYLHLVTEYDAVVEAFGAFVDLETELAHLPARSPRAAPENSTARKAAM